jgi:hypothetical protein
VSFGEKKSRRYTMNPSLRVQATLTFALWPRVVSKALVPFHPWSPAQGCSSLWDPHLHSTAGFSTWALGVGDAQITAILATFFSWVHLEITSPILVSVSNHQHAANPKSRRYPDLLSELQPHAASHTTWRSWNYPKLPFACFWAELLIVKCHDYFKAKNNSIQQKEN